VDETATGSATFFGPTSSSGISRIRVVHFHPPSIAPGLVALIWAVVLGTFVYFGLVAVGTSGAFAIVVAMVSFAAIWLFVGTRGNSA
jgi:hypothetical protein